MSNFQFLHSEWPDLATSAERVEQLALPDARATCFYARRTLELAVTWMYQNDDTLDAPYDDTLSARLHEPTFRRLVPQEVFYKARLLKDLGNEAVHSRRPIAERDGLAAARELFHVLYWLARTYTQQGADTLAGLTFDVAALSVEASEAAKTSAELKRLQEELTEKDRRLTEQVQQHEQTAAELDAEIARLKAEVASAKKANSAVPDTHDYSEAQTRDFFIDLLLREAGWPLDKKEDREYEVRGMPNAQGKGFVDYVLWGDDGLPLAVVEAKKTKKDPRVGRRQAELYADCLEAQFNRRPLIFYTNGYQHWFWDDAQYPPREVQGFFTKDELALILQRRTSAKSPSSLAIGSAIAERHYQHAAIRAVTEHLAKGQRKSLLVMATGSGKTRTVIALADLLMRAGWVKRMLVLADRVALVNQAANAFKTHLPSVSTVNLVMEKENLGSRVFVSTYPTMMGMIDEAKNDGTRRFGPGHFDLIVIDEAHRSVYQKYGAIFSYFDSLLVGLTATPKADVDRNTYRLFELEDGIPTFAYELEEAVADGFLVPPKAVSVPIKYPREGITYDDLSEAEKDAWDAAEWDESGDVPDKVEAAAVNKWLFNADTVDKVLKHLMEKGLKVDGGDRLGKTILFAKNHQHALFIEERFNRNFPHYKGRFARVIDNYESYAQSLIDDFSTSDKLPHLAISVDMLDTGIDIPDVVNLVFFKLVRSKTKFFQMLGRGTRLRPGLFGPGQDKECFYLFDYCGNFEFFSEHPDGIEGSTQEPLSKKLFLRRLELLQGLRDSETGDVGYADLDAQIADRLHTEVAAMNVQNFLVRPARQTVEAFAEREAWNDLPPESAEEVAELAGLPTELDPEDIGARQFDLLILNLQLAMFQARKTLPRLIKQVQEIAALLEEKEAIPLVKAQLTLIEQVQEEAFWQDITLADLENVRKKLRDLVKFIDRASRKIVYTDFADEIQEEREVYLPGLAASIDVAQYRKKVEQYLKAHLTHPVVQKVRDNLPLDQADLKLLEQELSNLSTDARGEGLVQVTQGTPLAAFVRRLVGLDREAAKQAFAIYLQGSTLNATQIQFINQIVDYLTVNGVMDPGILYDRQPFVNYSPLGLEGLFSDTDVERILQILSLVNANAGVPAGQYVYS